MKKLHNWLPSVQFSALKDHLFLIITLGKLVKASCSVSDYIVCLCRQSYYMIDRFIKTIQYTYDDHIIQTTDTMRVLAHMTHLFLYDMHWILRGNFTEWRLDNSVTRETDFHQNVSIFCLMTRIYSRLTVIFKLSAIPDRLTLEMIERD